jgi:hypothetical protein
MFLSGVAHNDLHYDNIFITYSKNPQIFYYNINNEWYSFKTNFIPKLYDFDQSYVVDIKNQYINDNYFKKKSVSNHLLNPRDFIKILCYVVHVINDDDNFKKTIYTKIFKKYNESDKKQKKYIKTFFINDSGCFFNERSRNKQKHYELFRSYKDLAKQFGQSYLQQNPPTTIQNVYYLNETFFNDYNLDSNKVLQFQMKENNDKLQKQYRLAPLNYNNKLSPLRS